MTRRTALILLLITALCSWVVLLLFTHMVAPSTPTAFIIFFAILLVALTSTIALLAYGLETIVSRSRLFSRKRHQSSIRSALRQGMLLALAIIFNLVLRALSSWSLLTAFAILLVAIVVEVAIKARR